VTTVLACHTAYEVPFRASMSLVYCNDEATLLKEQRQLSTQLTTWQKQIQQLAQREAGLPKRARANLPGAENQAPLPAAVTAAQCTARPGSNAQAGPHGSSDPAPLRSLQSSSLAPHSVQQLSRAATQNRSLRPTGPAPQEPHQAVRLSPRDGSHGAETRRMRMRQRLQAAEHRRRQAKEQAQVLVLATPALPI